MRLRNAPPKTPFHVVLVEPEIPQNTGNIGRICAATQCELHLVGRLGFRIDEHAVRRAGLDYWHLVRLHQHVSFEHYLHAAKPSRFFLLTAHAGRSYLDAAFREGDALVFGKESKGLDAELLEAHADRTLGIPTSGEVRSLNLANAVSIVVYDALRQIGALAGAALRD